RARFVRSHEYKLYDTGEMYNVKKDPLEQQEIAVKQQSKSEKSERKQLQKVLDTMPIPSNYKTPKQLNVK
ncbi:MAG: hypothetical protein VB066_00085, partial [Paludibacter sp.]|nr:hypothetical protein [Paludibacter sp.]